MTTIKPFYIKRTLGVTRQQIQDALDKCVSMGAGAWEGCYNTETTIEYNHRMKGNFGYFGVELHSEDGGVGTVLYSDPKSFGDDAIEITLDQLDEHLGIKQEPKEPKFKYVQVEKFSFDLKAEFEAGGLFSMDPCDEFHCIKDEIDLLHDFNNKNVYRRVELTEEDELIEALNGIYKSWFEVRNEYDHSLIEYLAKSGKIKLA